MKGVNYWSLELPTNKLELELEIWLPSFYGKTGFWNCPKNDSFQEYGSCFYAMEDFFSVVFDSFILNCSSLDNCSLSPLNFYKS